MAFKNDGGTFSKDLLAKLLLGQNGSASLDDIKNSEDQSEMLRDGSGIAMGGSLKPVSASMAAIEKLATGAGEGMEMGLADKIKQAASNSAIKVIPSAEDIELQRLKQLPKDFFEKYGSSRGNPPQQLYAGGIVNDPEKKWDQKDIKKYQEGYQEGGLPGGFWKNLKEGIQENVDRVSGDNKKYSEGGIVQGIAPVEGDSPENDIVQAELSPDEAVIPRTDMKSRKAAHKFIDKLFDKKEKK